MDSNKELKIFIGHGEKDDVIPLKSSQESLKPIESFSGLSKYIYPKLAHGISPQKIKDVKNCLKKIWVAN